MKKTLLLLASSLVLFAGAYIAAGIKEVKIKKDGETIVIKRENAEIPKEYLNPLRGKIAPFKLDKDIETIGELEVINYIKKSASDDSIILIDARTENWYNKIRIPTALNMPHTLFTTKENAIEAIMFNLDVEKKKDGSLDFSKAKTAIIYCNGAWCAQSAQLIKNAKYSLINLGYPKNKIKYYRGGMQAWVTLGLTTKSNNQ